MSVQRINFIEKGPMALTYRNMMIFAGLACVLCILIHCIFLIRYGYLTSKVTVLRREVQELIIQKDKTLAAMQLIGNQQPTNVAPLAALFAKLPSWSDVLDALVKVKPKQVWLENVRSVDIGEHIDMKRLEIAGKSVSNAAIAQFVGALDASGKFKNTVLMSSQKDKNTYTFLVNTEVPYQEAEW